MNVAVLGASGRAGSEITRELAARGHQVTAIARNPQAIPTGPGITAVAGDASRPEMLPDLIRGSDAVISALHFDVAAATLLGALRAAKVGRLLVTGGAASLEVAPGVRVFDSRTSRPSGRPAQQAGLRSLKRYAASKRSTGSFSPPQHCSLKGRVSGIIGLAARGSSRTRAAKAKSALPIMPSRWSTNLSKRRITGSNSRPVIDPGANVLVENFLGRQPGFPRPAAGMISAAIPHHFTLS